MPPAIVFTLVRNLRNEIDGRRILEAQTEFDAIRPLSVLRTRTVDIQEEREFSVGSHALLAIIIRHHGIWLQAFRQVPRTVLSQFQVFRLDEFLLLQISVGIAPRTPHHLLIAGYVLAVYRLLQLGFKRSILGKFGLALLLQCFLLRFQRLQKVSIHLLLQARRLRHCLGCVG